MTDKPVVNVLEDGSKWWTHTFKNFRVNVYVPDNELPGDIINYGYEAPYLLVFEEEKMDINAAKAFADQSGLSAIASRFDSSVVFVYPTCDGGWDAADVELYTELIEKSKIHEYHESGMAILNNRFTKKCDGYAIRGAIFRTYLFGKGKSADYIAKNLLKKIDGQGLWGPADVAPTAVVLEKLNVKPVIERDDMPIVSIGNSDDMNEYIMENTEYYYGGATLEYTDAFDNFLRDYKRWGWVGTLMDSPNFEKLGVSEVTGIVKVKTSRDNYGDDKGSEEHKVGYLAYYNKELFDNGPAPLVLCFHGGGDSAMHIAKVSEWYRVAADHNFLLVCVENHLNSTATEMMELLEHLYERFDIDKSRIYATGFSMGGCKSWDLYQEYPAVFAGLAPMDATFEVGCNIYGMEVEKPINSDVIVPIFYTGGEITPLPELPFQEQKCLDRMAYVFKVNKVVKEYNVTLDDVDNWTNKIWGIDGDRTEQIYDEDRDATLTLQYFDSEDGNCYSVFGSISGQGHECRYHTCNQAWLYLSKFRRVDGKIVIEDK